jgi:hypothetical protein
VPLSDAFALPTPKRDPEPRLRRAKPKNILCHGVRKTPPTSLYIGTERLRTGTAATARGRDGAGKSVWGQDDPTMATAGPAADRTLAAGTGRRGRPVGAEVTESQGHGRSENESIVFTYIQNDSGLPRVPVQEYSGLYV